MYQFLVLASLFDNLGAYLSPEQMRLWGGLGGMSRTHQLRPTLRKFVQWGLIVPRSPRGFAYKITPRGILMLALVLWLLVWKAAAATAPAPATP